MYHFIEIYIFKVASICCISCSVSILSKADNFLKIKKLKKILIVFLLIPT